ncbi:transmembrane domain-containing protein [Cryptosporidium canis]|uniref:Transmembrane domain-containing protein n=1 Tax=Cryptosporidium canis TaxID=195482 RepID=A0A9D5DG73_9CRYT|nr:transmembrane domain-containing protein [Cryptosporidium canis]
MLFSIDQNVEENYIQMLSTNFPVLSLTIGIILTIVGSCFMAFGNAYMKKGLHIQQQKYNHDSQASVPSMAYNEVTWWIGIVSYTFGAIIHIIALGFAPASILAPMNSFGLVANAFAAATLLDEKFGIFELVSTIGVIFGIFLCAVASVLPIETPINKYSGIDSWSDPYYLIYIIFCFISALAVLIVINNEEAKYNEQKEIQTRRAILKSLDEDSLSIAPTGKGSPNNSFNLNTHAKINVVFPKYPKYISMLYGFLAGLIGAQCVLEIKEMVAWGEFALQHTKDWMYNIQPYIAFIFFSISTWLQMHFLNLGLAMGDATLVVPTYYVFWTLFSTFGGFTKFHEFEGFTFIMTIIFFLGIIITTSFVIVMSVREILAFKKAVDESVTDNSDRITDETPELDITKGNMLDTQLPLAMGVLTMINAGKLAGKYFMNASAQLRKTRSASDLISEKRGSIEITSRQKDIWTLPSNVNYSNTGDPNASIYQNSVWRPKPINELIFEDVEYREMP